MTKAAKLFVVFVAVMSLLFAAFIGVTTLGGPNWQARADAVEGYGFTKTVTETATTWGVTRRVSAEENKTVTPAAGSLPAAIVAAQQDKLKTQAERLTAVDAELAEVRQTLEGEKQYQVLDEPGIPRRIEQLRADVAKLEAEILDLTQRGTQQAEAARKTRDVAEARRADAARLSAELAQVRADKFQVVEQQKRLNDLLVRLAGVTERAEQRNRQLKSQAPEAADGTAAP